MERDSEFSQDEQMMTVIRKVLSKCFCTAISLATLGVTQIDAAELPNIQPSIRSFFNNPDIFTATLSPSGQHLALIVRGTNGRAALGVVDTADLAKVKIVASSSTLDILSANWINDQRLYFSIGDTADVDDRRNGEVYAVNRDGSEQVQLTSRNGGGQSGRVPLPWYYQVRGSFDDDTDDLLVAKLSFDSVDGSLQSTRLYRLDSKTIKQTDLLGDLQPKNVVNWVLDKDNQPRFAISTNKFQNAVYYRQPGSRDWTEMASFHNFDQSAIYPVFMDGEGQVFAKKISPDGFEVLYHYDVKKREVAAEPFFQVSGFDANAVPVFERKTRKLVGLQFENDANSTMWLNEGLKAVQKIVDEKQPSTINQVICRDNDICLVRSFSDRDPGQFFLYQPKARTWVSIGASRSNINPRQMARQDFYRYPARDGMQIPVYVTTPVGKTIGPRPTVILVHGGPYLRGGHWGWNSQAQFLASRGYLVVEPDFRGSMGYGSKHFRAGWKQWGLAMQDDLADAANWAVAQGWADKNRIAIAGASYGGYATLMGLIKHPEIFRCGVNWVGVTDINLLYNVTWSDASEAYTRYGMPILVGDQEKDAAQLQATSPLVNAERLTQPLLMAYGVRDQRVPLVHGTKFRDAVVRNNKNVEWITYIEEGHGWVLEKNRLDFWNKVEAFLEKNLKTIQTP